MNVWFDKEKMDSILKNVISNALKYTPEKVTYSFPYMTLEIRGDWRSKTMA